ncbi:phosphate ABC transporter ATP-binding protein [Limnovirga soli]|jgi:phosphate transport system ATP-binding protein|uniref:ATP-binding cassette domain-containing protein n=1 Tax=Limnovirga soli TaxID=2656915 RepID=A0A8J8JSV3_9BACT|nr:phosphate ABC transporter ATP-binding protein [Limnovirga soli]NNV53989.1 ATP-binding cassette domain-containing protein [Limnovirga soli]
MSNIITSTDINAALGNNAGNEVPIVNIRNLNVRSKSAHILKDINLIIPKNKITVLLGPSGCGKTTLLKCMNRLTDLYSELKLDGSIEIDGEDILSGKYDITQIRQKMGLVMQRPFPLPMSIYDNIAYGLKLKGVTNKAIIKEKVEKHLKEVALWDEVKDRLKTSAQRLSIGQQQRLCLARGLAVEPEIILADEPTSALDPISSRVIEEEFSNLKDDYTIILVTHILRQAKRLADFVVFMYYGEIVEYGPANEIFENPKTDILKEYLQVGH